MSELTFRNAQENDVDAIVELLTGHSLGGTAMFDNLIGGKAEKRAALLRTLVEAGDTEYGYEQVTLAENGGAIVGLLLGYPRNALATLGPRTLSLVMRAGSLLSWPGAIRRQATFARLEPIPPQAAFFLNAICLRDATSRTVLEGLLGEAEQEAVDEECTSIIANVPDSAEEYRGLLESQGFAEASRRPIGDRKLRSALAADGIIQLRRETSFVPADDTSPAAEKDTSET